MLEFNSFCAIKIGILMRKLTLIFLFIFTTSCTSLNPVKMSASQLQHKIENMDIVKPGKEIKVYTANGKVHEFEVTSVSKTHITGKNISIPIKDIVALETREFSGGKTTLLVGSIGLVVYAIVGIIAFASLLGG